METEQALKANHSINPNLAFAKKKYALFNNVRNTILKQPIYSQ